MPGYVPEYESREAARFALYSWTQFSELDYWDRVYAIAHYRTHNMVEHHVQDAVTRSVKHVE